MRQTPTSLRVVAVTVLATAVLASTGCSFFRKGTGDYVGPPETRPLEVPPDLDLPNTDAAVKLPPSDGSVSRSSLPSPAPAAAANATGFTVPGDRDATFAKVGELLASTSGVTVASKAQILGTYDLDYAGSKFLLRVTKVEAGSYISAVDPRGLPAPGEAPAKLITALKASMGN